MKMAKKRYYMGWLFCLILLLQGCGNDASFDALLLPATATSTGCTFNGKGISGPIGLWCQTVGPVQFHVVRSAKDATPVANANVRIDIGNSVGDGVLLLDTTGTTCFNGEPIPDPLVDPIPSGCLSLNTRTDNLGVVEFQVRTNPVNGCGAVTTDITSTTYAQVTIAAASATWQMAHTITCAT